MKQSLRKRIERLEAWQAPIAGPEGPYSGALGNAILIGFALRVGGNAREELDAANGSLDPKRRVELTEQLKAARSIEAALAKYRPPKEIGTSPTTIQWWRA